MWANIDQLSFSLFQIWDIQNKKQRIKVIVGETAIAISRTAEKCADKQEEQEEGE